jgi:hypothetical protein
MRTIRQHVSGRSLAAVLALFLAAGGAAAWAATSPSGKTIHACFKRHGGALRVAGRCKHGERPLSWNQTGPIGLPGARGFTGKTGKTGAEGKQGPTGPAGPSDVYASGQALTALTTSNASYGSLSVPAGSYLIEAKATFVPGTGTSMTCELAPSTSLSAIWDRSSASGANTLSLIGAQTFAAAQAIELVCSGSAGGKLENAEVENAHLVAIRITTLHGALPVH